MNVLSSFQIPVVGAAIAFLAVLYHRLFVGPLSKVPGPWTYSISSWRLSYDNLLGRTSRQIHSLHAKYGPVIRIAPDHVTFNSLSALKTIYGVGSRSNRTSFYKIFEPYGRPTMFTMSGSADHAERKKFLVRAYAKTGIVKGGVADMIESKVAQLLNLFESESDGAEICRMLYYFTMDVSTAFIFTSDLGTQALFGNNLHRDLLHDVGVSKRGHRGGVAGILFTKLLQLLRMEQATSFKYVRAWALEAFKTYVRERQGGKAKSEEVALVAELCHQRENREGCELQGIDLASECADHLAAGIDTTRDTMVFLIWAMSLSENAHLQLKIREEVEALGSASFNEHGMPTVEAANRLIFVNAVVKEALRLYAPLPQLQPRFFDSDTMIDGYFIPARTTVSMAPFTQHRNQEIFDDPYRFYPERWLDGASIEMQRWWWPFSYGGRACTGMHLAMASMTTLVAALYSHYETRTHASFEGVSPAIVSLFEIFWDERFSEYQENTCFIDFHKLEGRRR